MKIETKDLKKCYGEGESLVTALKEVSICFPSGVQAAITGASGSGKTTLLDLIGGLGTPTEGSVLFDGRDIYSMSADERAVFRRRHIGYVFQAYNLIPELSARDNIVLPLLLDKRKKDDEFFSSVIIPANFPEDSSRGLLSQER